MRTPSETETITQAVQGYNNSPWVFEEDKYDVEFYINSDISAEEIVEMMRRADISAFRAEEAACENI